MNLEVKIEIRSTVKKEPNVLADGSTHSFVVYVQGLNGNNIEPFVKEVVFHLPPNAPNPEQVKSKPPYLISGSTKVSFRMWVDLFLHASENISKLRYSYFVPVPDKLVEKSLCVKTLTFLNAPQDFRERLLLGGAEAVKYEKKSKAVVVKAKSKSDPAENIQKQDVEIKKEICDELPNTVARSSGIIEKNDNLVIKKVLNFDELLKENKALKERNETLRKIYSNQERLFAAYAEKLAVVKQNATTKIAELNHLKEKSSANQAEIADLKLAIQRVTSEILQIKNSSKANNDGRTSPEVLLITD